MRLSIDHLCLTLLILKINKTFPTQTLHSRPCGRNTFYAKAHQQCSFSQSNFCSTLAALKAIFSSCPPNKAGVLRRIQLYYLNTWIWYPGGLSGDYVDHLNFVIFDVEWLDLENKIFLSELLCVELLLLLVILSLIWHCGKNALRLASPSVAPSNWHSGKCQNVVGMTNGLFVLYIFHGFLGRVGW